MLGYNAEMEVQVSIGLPVMMMEETDKKVEGKHKHRGVMEYAIDRKNRVHADSVSAKIKVSPERRAMEVLGGEHARVFITFQVAKDFVKDLLAIRR